MIEEPLKLYTYIIAPAVHLQNKELSTLVLNHTMDRQLSHYLDGILYQRNLLQVNSVLRRVQMIGSLHCPVVLNSAIPMLAIL